MFKAAAARRPRAPGSAGTGHVAAARGGSKGESAHAGDAPRAAAAAVGVAAAPALDRASHAADDRVENRTRPRPATVTGARRRLGRQRPGLQPAAAAAPARDAGVVDHGFDDAARAALGCYGPRDARASLRRANAVLERHEPLVGGVGRRRFDAAVVAVAGARGVADRPDLAGDESCARWWWRVVVLA